MIIEIRYWYNCIVLGSPFENFRITEFCSEPVSGKKDLTFLTFHVHHKEERKIDRYIYINIYI